MGGWKEILCRGSSTRKIEFSICERRAYTVVVRRAIRESCGGAALIKHTARSSTVAHATPLYFVTVMRNSMKKFNEESEIEREGGERKRERGREREREVGSLHAFF